MDPKFTDDEIEALLASNPLDDDNDLAKLTIE